MEQIRADATREASATVLNRLLRMTPQQSGRRAIETGPTGETVAGNIARLRKLRGLTTRQLSAALERAGRNVSASGITRMEKGERQVTTDDLTALAVVLGVSPVTLLLPVDARTTTEVTGAGEVDGRDAWLWAWCQEPLRFPEKFDEEIYDRLVAEFRLSSRPIGLSVFEDKEREGGSGG